MSLTETTPRKVRAARPPIHLRHPRRSGDDRIDVAPVARETVFDATNVAVDYGFVRAIEAVTMSIYRNEATALIGPSGCGKSTFLPLPEPDE